MRYWLDSEYSNYKLSDDNDVTKMYVQCDYDYISLAQMLGWNMQVYKGNKCKHNFTDGTVKCSLCKADVGLFIRKAQEYLDKHIGESFELDDIP
jgi:hypothetical protein